MFHRDEMFQIYLQRPPPPSPLRNRALLLSQQNSGSSDRPAQLLVSHVKQQSMFSSEIDADLVDEVDRALKLNETVRQTVKDSPAPVLSPNEPPIVGGLSNT
jgi:hypothetical protein